MHEEFWYFQFNLMFLGVGFLGELKFILIYFIDAANVKIKFLKFEINSKDECKNFFKIIYDDFKIEEAIG